MEKMFEIFGKIFFIAQQWQVAGDRELGRIGLTTKQWMLLAVLEKMTASKSPTVTETARAFGTSRQNVKRIAADLEAKGFIEIIRDGSDHRIQRFRLTGLHHPLFDTPENQEWQAGFIARFFQGISAEQLDNMQEGINTLLENLHAGTHED
ncbi:MAG: MarR family winged helix-turn-helix transcriptional regulator [Bacteroidota bacterium]